MAELVLRCPVCKVEMTGSVPDWLPCNMTDDWVRENLRCNCGVPQIFGETPMKETLISVNGVPAEIWWVGGCTESIDENR